MIVKSMVRVESFYDQKCYYFETAHVPLLTNNKELLAYIWTDVRTAEQNPRGMIRGL